MNKKIVQACQDAKASASPRITNQDIVDETGLSPSAVNNFLRGATKDPSIGTAGPICRMLGVSIDNCFGIEDEDQQDSAIKAQLAEALHEVETLRMQLDAMAREMMIYKRLSAIFGAMVLLAMIALILDLANPSIGWFRAPINAMLPLIMYF